VEMANGSRKHYPRKQDDDRDHDFSSSSHARYSGFWVDTPMGMAPVRGQGDRLNLDCRVVDFHLFADRMGFREHSLRVIRLGQIEGEADRVW